MGSPKVKTERTSEQTVPIGLNIDTKTGPRFFIAHPLKLTQAPLTVPLFSSPTFVKTYINMHPICTKNDLKIPQN